MVQSRYEIHGARSGRDIIARPGRDIFAKLMVRCSTSKNMIAYIMSKMLVYSRGKQTLFFQYNGFI